MKTVKGTPVYWKKILHDVLAMVKQLGLPTFFLRYLVLTYAGKSLFWLFLDYMASHSMLNQSQKRENVTHPLRFCWNWHVKGTCVQNFSSISLTVPKIWILVPRPFFSSAPRKILVTDRLLKKNLMRNSWAIELKLGTWLFERVDYLPLWNHFENQYWKKFFFELQENLKLV